ncbi:hypothetical protein JCM30237_30600 [Halolamina litorea]|uniref:DUF3426 domain-containing protein n=1 Tax=Halolamina litorea TaxID=1515593 RepID=A0ABD6BPE7_9EURY|nr:DUF3426 domain-containing protein [Halolamina litorea]
MKGNVVVLIVAIVAGVLTYGGLVGGEALLMGDTEPTADEAFVQETTTHLDRSGRPTAVGEVSNRYDGPITNVTVTVQFLRDGDVIEERTGRTLIETIPSGEVVPFNVHMREAAEIDEVETSVSYDRGGEVVSGLEVTEQRVLRQSQDQIDVSATITNRGDSPRELTDVVATFYDENGAAIGARSTRPGRQIQPGESVTVGISFRTLGDVPSYAREFASFRVAIAGEEVE